MNNIESWIMEHAQLITYWETASTNLYFRKVKLTFWCLIQSFFLVHRTQIVDLDPDIFRNTT